MRGLPPFDIRAEIGSVDEESRVVEVIFSTGAAVERYDCWTGKRYLEVLSLKPEHIKLDRLNSGAPLLDSHSAWSVGSILGVVERGSARVEKNKALAKVRFSRRDDVEPIWQDVRDGIVGSVSVGYRTHRFEETAGKDGGLPTRVATLWQPFEISIVAMPADAGARVRENEGLLNSCIVVRQVTDADRARTLRLAKAIA